MAVVPHVSMPAILWVSVVCGFGVYPVISQHFQNHSFKAEEVFITDTLCESGQEVDAGTPFGNWKRVLFPTNSKCQGSFVCTINFRYTESDTHTTDICVDFSRMKIKGHRSYLVMKDETGSDLDALSEKRYPQRDKYISTKFCTNKKHTLKMTFTAGCDEHLDKIYIGWMYVFVQSTATGSIYFLDGGARHHHKMLGGMSRMSLRSHVWAGVPHTSTDQLSTLRLSVHKEYRSSTPVCFEWNPAVMPTVPRGVSYRIFEVYVNEDRALSTYAEMSEGEVVKSPTFYHNCHSLRLIREVVVEVRRDTWVSRHGLWDERRLLFDIVVGLDNEGKPVYGPLRPQPGYHTSTAIYSTTHEQGEDQTSFLGTFWEEYKTIICACISVPVSIVLFYCCCCKKGTSNGKDDTTNAEDNNMMADTPRNDDDGTVEADSRPREPEAYLLMPRTSPSAPSLNEVTEDPGGEGAVPRVMTCDPPSYYDLFPEK
ncbi:uncharacterized protein LOC143300035 [Babylonia areolata]|uniref:uncharacterized protein LOC143300035 n=1 Tax=Babylonia areolata TaxID=304850 RepID=UPI003FD35517